MAATNEIFDFSKRLDFGNSAADLLPNIAVEVHFRTSCYEGLLKLKLKGFSSSGRLELVSGHLGEGLLELLGDPLQLLLLAHQLVLQSVNLFLKFLDGLFSKFSSGFGLLQLCRQGLDLLLVAYLPLVGLLLGHLQRLQVRCYNLQLLLQLHDLGLPHLSSLLCSLKVGLSHLQLL